LSDFAVFYFRAHALLLFAGNTHGFDWRSSMGFRVQSQLALLGWPLACGAMGELPHATGRSKRRGLETCKIPKALYFVRDASLLRPCL